ncbi:helix-turn-helix domain-containing protein [Arthrobacter sp. 135MFCol5.1]|uniref:helix-turn-helix domain-containing protein n=1 Tax=Arthrobacter sp. 135MFCol5.1 TaxID=1158050 RepID=UPI0018CB3C79
MSQKGLADRLGVGESRVSQIFSGNGNIQISTFAKVMRGLGYKIELRAVPADPSVPPLPERRVRKHPKREKKMRTDTVIVTRGGSSGVDSRTLDFIVPEEDFGAFYDVQSLHPTTRRPAPDKLEIDWEEIDWDAPVRSLSWSDRKEARVGEPRTS